MDGLWSMLLVAVGLVLVLEGVVYALFPESMQKAMAVLQTASPSSLRGAGLAAALVGAGLVWLVLG